MSWLKTRHCAARSGEGQWNHGISSSASNAMLAELSFNEDGPKAKLLDKAGTLKSLRDYLEPRSRSACGGLAGRARRGCEAALAHHLREIMQIVQVLQ
jgi:hypothetical protein